MKLLLLRCPVCQTPLKPGNEDILLDCTACQTAVMLAETGVSVAEVQYAQPRRPDLVTHWLPFWITHGRVRITNRQTQGKHRRAQREAQEMWAQPRLLYTPAWDLPLPQARQVGSQLIRTQPALTPIERPPTAHLTAANITAEDGQKLLEFIILTIEAERPDWLRALEFAIEAPAPQLWALPAQSLAPPRLLL